MYFIGDCELTGCFFYTRTRCETRALTRKSLNQLLIKHPKMVQQLLVNAQNLDLNLSSLDIENLVKSGHNEAAPSVWRSLTGDSMEKTESRTNDSSARVEMNGRSYALNISLLISPFFLIAFLVDCLRTFCERNSVAKNSLML